MTDAHYCRKWRAKRKGIQPEPVGGIYDARIPSERLLPLVERYERGNGTPHPSTVRRIWDIRHGLPSLTFDAADRLLIELGMEHEWHGELADLYEEAA